MIKRFLSWLRSFRKPRYIMGVDFGAGPDQSAAVIAFKEPNGTMKVHWIGYAHPGEYETSEEFAAAVEKEWGKERRKAFFQWLNSALKEGVIKIPNRPGGGK